jgi:glycyl-tRNA synthetase beta chain
VSLADKLDTVVGLFAAGEKPTGSRDPYGLRRAAQGVMKILVDGAELLKSDMAPNVEGLIDRAFANFGGSIATVDEAWKSRLFEFMSEREAHLFERRGHDVGETRAVARFWRQPHNAYARILAVSKERTSAEFLALAEIAKRVNNITKDVREGQPLSAIRGILKEPSEVALADDIDRRWPKVHEGCARHDYTEAMRQIVGLRQPLDRFFTDVLVMAEDQQLRQARLSLLTAVRDTIASIADISEIVVEDGQA